MWIKNCFRIVEFLRKYLNKIFRHIKTCSSFTKDSNMSVFSATCRLFCFDLPSLFQCTVEGTQHIAQLVVMCRPWTCAQRQKAALGTKRCKPFSAKHLRASAVLQVYVNCVHISVNSNVLCWMIMTLTDKIWHNWCCCEWPGPTDICSIAEIVI